MKTAVVASVAYPLKRSPHPGMKPGLRVTHSTASRTKSASTHASRYERGPSCRCWDWISARVAAGSYGGRPQGR
jgi:hypothetical protein